LVLSLLLPERHAQTNQHTSAVLSATKPAAIVIIHGGKTLPCSISCGIVGRLLAILTTNRQHRNCSTGQATINPVFSRRKI